MTRAPYLDEVLPLVRPDRNVRLRLSPEQKHATQDRDGLLLRLVLRALLDARHRAGWRGHSFPLTPLAVQAILRALGHQVGLKRCRTLLRRARQSELLLDAGSYRARWPIRRVPLYLLGARIVGLGRTPPSSGLRQRSSHSTGGRRSPVKVTKRLRWYAHGLFGMPDGGPPPLSSGKPAARLWARDEVRGGALVGLRSVARDGKVVLA